MPPTSTPDAAATRRRVVVVVLLLVVVLVLVAVGVALVWLRGGEVPAAVGLTTGSAANSVGGPAAGAGGAPTPSTDGDPDRGDLDAPALVDATGTWVADHGAQRFDLAAGTGTFVGYRIDEQLVSIGATTAVGRTPEVDAQVEVEGATVVAATVRGDLSSLRSDDTRRDSRVRGLFSGDATAVFELGAPVALPAVPALGEVVATTAPGTLTVEGVGREVEVDLEVTVRGERLVVVGSVVVALADLGVRAPTAPAVLSVADEVTVEWQLLLSRT